MGLAMARLGLVGCGLAALVFTAGWVSYWWVTLLLTLLAPLVLFAAMITAIWAGATIWFWVDDWISRKRNAETGGTL